MLPQPDLPHIYRLVLLGILERGVRGATHLSAVVEGPDSPTHADASCGAEDDEEDDEGVAHAHCDGGSLWSGEDQNDLVGCLRWGL